MNLLIHSLCRWTSSGIIRDPLSIPLEDTEENKRGSGGDRVDLLGSSKPELCGQAEVEDGEVRYVRTLFTYVGTETCSSRKTNLVEREMKERCVVCVHVRMCVCGRCRRTV